jgi:hypothetical protein
MELSYSTHARVRNAYKVLDRKTEQQLICETCVQMEEYYKDRFQRNYLGRFGLGLFASGYRAIHDGHVLTQ